MTGGLVSAVSMPAVVLEVLTSYTNYGRAIGGREQIQKELGEAIYGEGVFLFNGYNRYHLLYRFCNDWMRDNDGEWVRQDIEPLRQC